MYHHHHHHPLLLLTQLLVLLLSLLLILPIAAEAEAEAKTGGTSVPTLPIVDLGYELHQAYSFDVSAGAFLQFAVAPPQTPQYISYHGHYHRPN